MKGSDLSAFSTYRWIMNAPDLPSEAERRRGVTLDERSGRTASTPSLPPQPMPTLFVVVMAMGVGLLVLAVVGTYTLIQEVFHS